MRASAQTHVLHKVFFMLLLFISLSLFPKLHVARWDGCTPSQASKHFCWFLTTFCSQEVFELRWGSGEVERVRRAQVKVSVLRAVFYLELCGSQTFSLGGNSIISKSDCNQNTGFLFPLKGFCMAKKSLVSFLVLGFHWQHEIIFETEGMTDTCRIASFLFDKTVHIKVLVLHLF